MDIKEESHFQDFSSEKEREFFTKGLINKAKTETVTSGTYCHIDIKTEIKEETEVSNLHSKELSSEDPVIGHIKSKIDTKIKIKEEQWWLQGSSTETLCSYDDIKDRPEEHFHSIESPRLKEVNVSTDIPEFFSNEELGNDTSFNIRKDSPECTSVRKCQSVCSKTLEGGKILSMSSCMKHNHLLNANKQNINKENCKLIFTNAYKKAYKCDICHSSFKYWFHLKKHRLVHDSKKVEVCEERFGQLQHLKIHQGKKPQRCNICNRAFIKLQGLKKRKLLHKGIKPHKCNICNKAFTYLGTLKRHKLIHEGIKSYKCDICNKAFTHLKNLKTHILLHEGIKPHKCNICNKAFTDITTLKRHRLIHQGVKPHKCNICNKAFLRLSDLQRHKLIHEGIKPHKCSICNKAFTQLSNFKRHKLFHEDIKPHKCNVCHKSFTDLSALKRHKLIHEGIKPHKCKICNKAFTQMSTLKRHKLIHEYNKPQ